MMLDTNDNVIMIRTLESGFLQYTNVIEKGNTRRKNYRLNEI